MPRSILSTNIMIGQMIAHYRIVEKLGAGGMGVIYRAEDTRLGRSVAIKLLPCEPAEDPVSHQRFQREARAASALNHANICTIYEINEFAGQHYIVMELLEGKTLSQLIDGQPLAPDKIIKLAVQIADALEAAHQKGIVHRDIKPSNVFITQREQVKILDFGLAKLGLNEEEAQPEFPASGENTGDAGKAGITMPRPLIGSIPYMSPEQVRGEELDPRTDLFSLGSVLYEMSTGSPPFRGLTQTSIFQEILNRTPIPPARLNTQLPHELNKIINKLLEKDRELRYQTAADLHADLKRLRRDFQARRNGSDNLSAGAQPNPSGISDTPFTEADGALSPAANFGAGIGRVFRTLRRRKFAVLSAALLILMAGIAWLRTRAVGYYPCIVFADFNGGSDSVNAGLIGFAVKRTLSQFPELVVVDQQEFAHIRQMDKNRNNAESSSAAGGLRKWGLDRWWRPDVTQPMLTVSGRVTDSLGSLELEINTVRQGRKAASAFQFRGVDDLLNNGIDSIARRLIDQYDSDLLERMTGTQPNYRSAVQLLSRHWDALRHYWSGAEAWRRLDMPSAERELRSALEIDPSFALAHLMLGEVRVFQNQWDAAQSEILAARKEASALTEIDQLRVEAFLARVFGKPFEERIQLQKLIGLQPHRKEYIYELAESYFHTADADEAISKYLDALKLDNRYALAYNHIGYCYSWKGDYPRAFEAMQNYLEIDGSGNALDSFGDAYMHAGLYDKAAEMKWRALKSDSQLYYANTGFAYIDILCGRNKNAEEFLKSLLGRTDDRIQKARYYAVLAFLYYHKGAADQAAQACALGIQHMNPTQYDEPNDQLVWLDGLIALEQKKLPGAKKALAQLRRMCDSNGITAMNYKPVYKYWLHLRAETLAAEGMPREAANAINDLKWVKGKLGYWSTPFDCAFFMNAIGRIYEKMKSPDEAERSYRDALAYNPHFGLARFNLASLFWARGSRENARREIKTFLEEWQKADQDAPEIVAARRIMTR